MAWVLLLLGANNIVTGQGEPFQEMYAHKFRGQVPECIITFHKWFAESVNAYGWRKGGKHRYSVYFCLKLSSKQNHREKNAMQCSVYTEAQSTSTKKL